MDQIKVLTLINEKYEKDNLNLTNERITTDIFNFKAGEILLFRSVEYGKNKNANHLLAITKPEPSGFKFKYFGITKNVMYFIKYNSFS